MYLDATATYELNRKLHPGKKIVVFGRSMCGAVAAHLAKDVSRTALVLEAAISSLRYAMHEQVPLTRFLPRYLIMRSKLETTKHVSTRLVPTLILHGNSSRLFRSRTHIGYSKQRQSRSKCTSSGWRPRRSEPGRS